MLVATSPDSSPLLLVPNQNAPTLRQPPQRSFHHPPTRRIAFVAPRIQFLLPNSPNMRLIAVSCDSLVSCRIVISFVQTQMLRTSLCWRGTLGHHTLQRRLQQLGVVYVRARHHDAQRPSTRLYKDTALGSWLGAVGGFGPTASPPNELFPSKCPPTAIPSPRLSTPRTGSG